VELNLRRKVKKCFGEVASGLRFGWIKLKSHLSLVILSAAKDLITPSVLT
jgi:hypothetical protein